MFTILALLASLLCCPLGVAASPDMTPSPSGNLPDRQDIIATTRRANAYFMQK